MNLECLFYYRYIILLLLIAINTIAMAGELCTFYSYIISVSFITIVGYTFYIYETCYSNDPNLEDAYEVG